jgi:hypothetical protein
MVADLLLHKCDKNRVYGDFLSRPLIGLRKVPWAYWTATYVPYTLRQLPKHFSKYNEGSKFGFGFCYLRIHISTSFGLDNVLRRVIEH